MTDLTIDISMTASAELVERLAKRALAEHVRAETGAAIIEDDIVIDTATGEARIHVKAEGDMLIGMFRERSIEPAPTTVADLLDQSISDLKKRIDDSSAPDDAPEPVADLKHFRDDEAGALMREYAAQSRFGSLAGYRTVPAPPVDAPLPEESAVAMSAPEPVAEPPAVEEVPLAPADFVAPPSFGRISDADRKREGGWTLRMDADLISATVMGKSDGNIAAKLKLKVQEVRSRRQMLVSEYGADPAKLAPKLNAEVKAADQAVAA